MLTYLYALASYGNNTHVRLLCVLSYIKPFTFDRLRTVFRFIILFTWMIQNILQLFGVAKANSYIKKKAVTFCLFCHISASFMLIHISAEISILTFFLILFCEYIINIFHFPCFTFIVICITYSYFFHLNDLLTIIKHKVF